MHDGTFGIALPETLRVREAVLLCVAPGGISNPTLFEQQVKEDAFYELQLEEAGPVDEGADRRNMSVSALDNATAFRSSTGVSNQYAVLYALGVCLVSMVVHILVEECSTNNKKSTTRTKHEGIGRTDTFQQMSHFVGILTAGAESGTLAVRIIKRSKTKSDVDEVRDALVRDTAIGGNDGICHDAMLVWGANTDSEKVQ